MTSSHDHAPPMAEQLAALARLAMEPPSSLSVDHIARGCAIVRDALNAEDAYIIRAGDPHFIRLGSDAAPTAYEIKQKGYYLLWRELAANPGVAIGGARVADRLVERAVAPRVGARPTHLAAILPGYESNSDMIIVRGPWPDGLTADHLTVMEIARPLLASLVSGVLDGDRQARQRRQLSLLADVAAAFSEAREMDSVLTAIATAVAKASGFDWVNIVLFDAALERIVDRARNVSRYSDTATYAEFWDLDNASAAVWLADARRMQRSGRPILMPDVFVTQPREAQDDVLRRHNEALRRYYERAHILSAALFPIRFQNQVVGTMSFSAATRHAFDPEEVAFLTALVSQAASGIGGLRLHEELRRANASLAHLATHDALTGLANRALLHDRLEHALARQDAEGGQSIALLFIDLDNFKVINDTLGHQAGDNLLVEVAARLTASVRHTDTVARFGGDEFVILLEGDATRSAALTVAERLLAVVRAPLTIAGREVVVGASAGIALGMPGATAADDLLREADTALYQAKDAGKAQAAIFDVTASVRTRARLDLETGLRGALERGEFVLHYQPEVELTGGRTVGVEALVRWQRPGRGLVTPERFIPLAEESGLIVPLGGWVLGEACRQAAVWQRQGRGTLVMSVNVAAQQLARRDLPEQVAEVLGAAGLPPAALRLEVTESAVLADMELAVANLAACRELGVLVALDDFGTGYSSLSYLASLPVDVVKIDRSFVQRLDADKGAAAIMRAVMVTARALGLDVTVEGIETAEQLMRVRAMRCRRGQGFYFARPLPAEAFAAWLAGRCTTGTGRRRTGTAPAPLATPAA
jgi:diguanylate cyclase (GGDEF)-like protein